MMNVWIRLALILPAAAVLAGCWETRLNVRPENSLGDSKSGSIHFNAAEYRAILSVPRGERGGRFITCVEPSPDIAKVFGTAFGVAAEGTEPKIGLQASLAVSMSRAASAAQLGERLATIQLLRDVLYRACEAYANGALDETSYSVIMSRMDDMIVTMLLGELTAGNFGRRPASLSAAAGGTALSGGNGRGQLAEALKEEAEADAALRAEAEALDAARTHLAETCAASTREKIAEAGAEAACDGVGEPGKETGAGDNNSEDNGPNGNDNAGPPPGGDSSGDRGDDAAPDTGQIETAAEDVEDGKAEKADAEARAYIARAHTQAVARSVTGGIDANVSDKRAEHLTELARKYLENVNFDALMVACLHAMHGEEPGGGDDTDGGEATIVSNAIVNPGARVGTGKSALSDACHHMMTEGPFRKLMESAIRMIEAKKRRIDLEQLIADFGHFSRAVHLLGDLLDVSKQAAPSRSANGED